MSAAMPDNVRELRPRAAAENPSVDEPVLAADANFREWVAARGGFRWTTRRIPGFNWVSITLTTSGRCEPGHGPMYRGLIRRDTFTLGGVGLVVMSMRRRDVAVQHRRTA